VPKTLATVVALVLITIVVSRGHAATTEQCGDADLNGARTVTDGVLVLRTAADLTGGCTLESSCDVDGNLAVTVTDGVAALRLAAGLPFELRCPHTVRDFSDFRVFTFNHRLSFGYCPRIGAPSRVILAENDAGDVVLNATVIVEGTPGDPACIEDATPVPAAACVKEEERPARVLTDDEVTRVRNAFTAIVNEQQRNPDCGRVAIEPCLIDELNWDGFVLTDFECGAPRLPPDQGAALVALFDTLVSP
jgi:hypothetical protein